MDARVELHAVGANPGVVVCSMPLAFGISVVIPAFNRLDSLIRAIDSVECSNRSLVEIIVVDDGSSEDLRKHLPQRNKHGVVIRCLRFPVNRGPQAARNLGMRRARFTYVAFLDSDDTFHSQKLDVVLAKLSSDSVDLLFHAVTGMGKYNWLARTWSRYLSGWLPFHWLAALYNPVVTPGLIVRHKRCLGVPWLRFCEDYSFILRYSSADTRVTYLDAELSAVYRRPFTQGGLSSSAWRMRKGEFSARRVLLKEGTCSALMRFAIGSCVGFGRIILDVVRLRYWRLRG